MDERQVQELLLHVNDLSKALRDSQNNYERVLARADDWNRLEKRLEKVELELEKLKKEIKT